MVKLYSEIPRLEDDRIILRKIDMSDAPALKQMTESVPVYRYLPTFLVEKQYDDMQEALAYIYGDCFRRKESLILGIYEKPGGNFCGLAEFYGLKDAIHKTCIGYRLAEACWGRGIATRAVALMVAYLYTRTDIEIITASTMIENHASARVLEKNGFIMTAHAVPEDWGYGSPTIADKWFR